MAKTAKKRCEDRLASCTVPSHCVWRSASTSGRNRCRLAPASSTATSVCSDPAGRCTLTAVSAAVSRTGFDGNMAWRRLLGNEVVLDLEIHLDLPHPLADGQQLADFRVEEVLQQGRARGLEVEPGIVGHAALDGDSQLVGAGGRLDYARRVRDPEGTQRARAVVAVVEKPPVADAHDVEKIRAETDHQDDDAGDRADAVVDRRLV